MDIESPAIAPTPPDFRQRWRWATYPVGVFLLTRLGIALVAGFSWTIDTRTHRPLGPMTFPAVESMCMWDCAWFQRIAMDGYAQPGYSNFFPLFAMIGRYLSLVTHIPIPLCLIIAANLAGLVGLIVIYRIFVDLEGSEIAQTALLMWAVWPFSFFQAAGYPESLMVLSTSAAILFAMRRRHYWAGTALGIGILARHLTVVGGPALIVAHCVERGPRLRNILWHRSIIGLFIPVAIAALYPLFLTFRFGNPLIWWQARQQGWGEAAWYGLVTFFRLGPWEPHIPVYVALSVVPAVGAVLLVRWRKWWVLAGYGATLMGVLYAIGLMGLGRYTGSAWPCFLPLAVLVVKRPTLRMPLVTVFASLQGMFVYLYSHSYPIN